MAYLGICQRRVNNCGAGFPPHAPPWCHSSPDGRADAAVQRLSEARRGALRQENRLQVVEEQATVRRRDPASVLSFL